MSIFITVHDDLTYTWSDPKTMVMVERATILPDKVWRQTTNEERARITARIAAISHKIGQRYSCLEHRRMGLSHKQSALLISASATRRNGERS